MQVEYNIIVPRADRTGPTNLAVDIGKCAARSGWRVRLLYLSASVPRDDLHEFAEVRKFRLTDICRISGIVHSHGFRPDFVGWFFTWAPRRCIVASTLHGHFPQHLKFDHPAWKVTLAWFVWSKLLKRFDVCACISQSMLRHYKRYLPYINSRLAYNFRSQAENCIAETAPDVSQWIKLQRVLNRKVLVYVGSLSTRKNVLALVRQVIQCPELGLVLCGQGALMDTLCSVTREANCDNIFFAGQLASPDSVIRMSDVLVLPSSAEGLPLVVLEAARIGVPSLLSNIAVHRELERLGLGRTFDRIAYRDFREKAIDLAKARSAETDNALVNIWRKQFSPELGFTRYAELLLSPRAIRPTRD